MCVRGERSKMRISICRRKRDSFLLTITCVLFNRVRRKAFSFIITHIKSPLHTVKQERESDRNSQSHENMVSELFKSHNR
jgi:hypothetical protein